MKFVSSLTLREKYSLTKLKYYLNMYLAKRIFVDYKTKKNMVPQKENIRVNRNNI